MFKNKTFLSLMLIGIVVLFFAFSRKPLTPEKVENMREPETNVSSASQGEPIATQNEPVADKPVHPGRAKLQQQMQQETFKDTFYNLPTNDNLAMLIPLMGSRPFSPGVYESDVIIVSKMIRVRKLLEDARRHPDEVSVFLQQQLRVLGKEYSQQYTTFLEALNEAGADGVRSKELPENQKNRLLCTAAVYVLSQIRADDALATMVWLSTQGQEGEEISWPVNRKFLYYAMHKIIQQSPGSKFLGSSHAYLEKAKAMNIPEAKSLTVTTWNAYFHERDFRRMHPDGKLGMHTQPTIELERFPSLKHLSLPETETLLAELRDLVE